MASKIAPFPFPFRVGTDICKISRVKSILNGPTGAKFINRVLTEEEQTAVSETLRPILEKQPAAAPGTVEGEKDPGSPSGSAIGSNLSRFMASRFAAKEAVFKATNHKVHFHDVIIAKKKSGQPFAILKAKNGIRQDREALISLSHDGDYATAVAIVALDEAWPSEPKDTTDEAVGEGAASGEATSAGTSPEGETTT